jgi:lipid A 3-O-deacylase
MEQTQKSAFGVSIAALLAVVITASFTSAQASDGSRYDDYCNGATDTNESAQPGWYWNWENDVAGVIKSDNSYTQGAQLGYTFKYRENDPNLFQRMNSPLCRLFGFKAAGQEGKKLISAGSMYIGQQLYTPRDKNTTLPIPDDRPYAGWGYIGLRQELLRPLQPNAKSGHRRWVSHSFDLQMGVVGSAALGEETQRAAHALENTAQSNGWDNQITDRFGAQMHYNFSARTGSLDVGSTVLDALVTGGVALGNIQQSAEIGGMLRWGRNMGPIMPRAVNPSPFTASMLPVGEAANGNSQNNDSRDCAWLRAQECYGFIGVTARGVRRNVFLEPTLSGAGANISPEPLVYEATFGVRLRYKWARFDYVSTTRSREFNPAPANPLERKGRHDFGSLTMSCYGNFGDNSGDWQWVCPGVVAGIVGFLALR